MSENVIILATKRERVGKGSSRLARREKMVPASLYGGKEEAMSILVKPNDIIPLLHKSSVFSTIFKVEIDGKQNDALIRNVQIHPVTDLPIHVDFLRVAKDTLTRMEIPLVFINQEKSMGIKLGGVLNVVQHYVEVQCNPADAPKSFEIDLATAGADFVLKIEDITLPANSKTFYPKGFAFASIASVTEEKEATETTTETTTDKKE
jgi:large subunit ribosomal protein L25